MKLPLWFRSIRLKIAYHFCRHNRTVEIFRYPPDNYVVDKCCECGKEIYNDL